jgi:hypothetical protein
MHQDHFKWSTHEYGEKSRSTDWYWAIGLISIIGSVVAFLNNNFLFGVFIILCGFSFILVSNKKPMLLNITVDEDGITINNVMYPYNKIHHFFIDHRKQKLFVATQRMIMPLLIIPINEIHSNDLENFLKNYAKEKETEEPFSHKILDIIGL